VVTGLRVNDATGEVEVLLEPAVAPGRGDALLSAQDVEFVMKRGVDQASFSLDPTVRGLRMQPTQEATFQPASLAGGDVVKTMLLADYLLKVLASGTEMSAKAPFLQRPTNAPGGTTARLNPVTRDAVRSVETRRAEMELGAAAGLPEVVCSRKWFKCGEVRYERSGGDGCSMYTISDCDFSVQQQVFRRRTDADGPVPADATDYVEKEGLVEMKAGDGHPESAHEAFVRDMNAHLPALCAAYPELARLRELHKLMAMSRLLMQHIAERASAGDAGVAARVQARSGYCVDPAAARAAHAEGVRSCNLIPTTFVLNRETVRASDAGESDEADGGAVRVGEIKDLQDDCFFWYTARVVAESGPWRLMRWDGYGKEFDVWMPAESPRIAPQNTHTPKGRSAGQGTGVFKPPPVATPVQVQRPGALEWRAGTVVESTKISLLARLDGGGEADVPVPPHVWGRVRYPPIVYTPTAEDIAAGVAAGRVRVGQSVDIRDEYFNWYTGHVLKVDPATNSVLVSYESWGEDAHAWVPCSDKRLAPLHAHTPDGVRTSIARDEATGKVGRVGFTSEAPPVGTRVLYVYGGEVLEGQVTESRSEPKATVRVVFEGQAGPGMEFPIAASVVREVNPVLFNAAPAAAVASGELSDGQDVDVRDSCYAWYTATVKSAGPGYVVVAYHGWRELWHERITVPSPRIAPLHTHTKPGYRSAPQSVSAVVPPPEGSPVLARSFESDDDTYKPAVVVSVEESRVGLQFEGAGEVTWLQLPLRYGTLQDPQPVTLDLHRVSSWTMGGIKIQPSLRRVDCPPVPFLGASTCPVLPDFARPPWFDAGVTPPPVPKVGYQGQRVVEAQYWVRPKEVSVYCSSPEPARHIW
jgi:hypothetical protein